MISRPMIALTTLIWIATASPWLAKTHAVFGGEVILAGMDGSLAPIIISAPFVPEHPDCPRGEFGAEVVEDLVYHMEQMTGRRPEVHSAAALVELPTPAVVLGERAQQLGAAPQHETVMAESFRLLTRDGRVLIGGESLCGVAHGVYELLRQLGCDWIFPGPEGEVIPSRQTVTIGPLDLACKPTFEMRSPWYSGGPTIVTDEEQAEFRQWRIRQQQTLPGARRHPTFLAGGGHYWHGLMARNRELLEARPEMRALTRLADGTFVRTWGQLEAANPDVVDLTVRDIRETFARNDWPHDKAISMFIGPNDGGGYSVSPEAMAAGASRRDPLTGDNDQTDVLVHYANRVLEELEDDFPNLYLGWYLYHVHADYPMRHHPHPRLTISIADITHSRYHSLQDRSSATRTYYRGVLEQWARLHRAQGNPLSFYGYNWNLAENMLPYSKMKIWGQDLPYYHAMGVSGHNNEQDKAWSILGPHNYLMARMGWNIELEWEAVLARYCELAFGPGAPYMERYYHLLIEAQEAGSYEAGGYGSVHLVFDRTFVEKSKELLQLADQAAESAFHRRNVDYFGQPVTALELYLDYLDAVNSFDFVQGQQAYQAMIAHWEKYLEKNSNLVSRYGRRYLENWLFGPYVRQGLRYSSGAYHIIHPFADELPTALDPNTKGQFMGFYRPEMNHDGWITTRTYSTSWDAQGMGPYRQGAVWYRIPFDLPGSVDDAEGLGVFIGAVEDEVHVWCNGVYVGQGRGFIRPFAFDITDHVHRDRENLLALQVVRRDMVNENWRGGLMYPSFVFAGPRLDEPAPRQELPYRTLPGGGREPIRD